MTIPTVSDAPLEMRRIDAETGVPMDHQDRYLIPDPADPNGSATGRRRSWQRATNFAGMLAERFALEIHAQNCIIEGIGSREDLRLLSIAAALKPGDRKLLRQIRQQASAAGGGDAKANQGTGLHVLSEVIDRGGLPEALEALGGDEDMVRQRVMCRAYANMLARENVQLPPEELGIGEGSELVFIVPALNVAGRLDKVRLVRGRLAIVDAKTGQNPSKHSQVEIAIQLALAAHAEWLWFEDEGRLVPMPLVDQRHAYVAHVPFGGDHAELIDVDIAKGWLYAQLALQVREARADSTLFFPLGRVGAEEEWARPIDGDQVAQVLAELAPAPVQVETPRGTATPDPAPGGTEQGTEAPTVTLIEWTPAIVGEPQAVAQAVEHRQPQDLRMLGEKGLDALGEQLADPTPAGRRGCGACGRIGHKRGNPRCLGDQDPLQLGAVPIEPDPEEHELQMAAAGHAQTAAEKLADVANTAPPWCTCPAPAAGQHGWIKRPDGIYLHKEPGCGLPSWAATQRAVASAIATTRNDDPGVVAMAAQAVQFFTSHPDAQPPESAQPWPPANPSSPPSSTPAASAGGTLTPAPAGPGSPGEAPTPVAASTAPPVTAPPAGPIPSSAPAPSTVAPVAVPRQATPAPEGPLQRIFSAENDARLAELAQELMAAGTWSQEIALAFGRRQYELSQAPANA
jgi:hypothetical protein